ncbi:uncharacterized protein LOC110458018 isoform X1 [Mizuhopecten yessoensis]|uniref:uncharacterized protein LOC110458018 isoform X1 n=1 Tax=Mizuhopecten yessoensis TaxID=6573 RepID=UPI000B45E886|nr:uncharacterized protein LOC110458018 isoform X1 [Mizuhopecten yessoensis]
MSSTLSVVECRPPMTPREGSYPQLRNKSKIAKGCHLSSVTRLSVNNSNHSFDPNVCPVQGSSFPGGFHTQKYTAPQNSPRNRPSTPRSTFKEDQSISATPDGPPKDDRPLSVVGGRFSSLSGTTSRAISRVSSNVPPGRTGTTASFYKPPKDLSEIVLAYDDSGEGEPNGPPPTPSECSISSFKVDGLRIGSVCETRCTQVQSSRDFNPGYVKRVSYCCDKCADRMTCHESLVMDSSSPFYAYQRYTTADNLERCTSHYTPISDDIHKFLESSLSCSLDDEQKRQVSRLWVNKSPEDPVKPSSSPTEEEHLDSCNAAYSSSSDVLDEKGEQELTVSDLDNNKKPLVEKKYNDGVSHVNLSTPEQTTVDKETKEHMEKTPDRSQTAIINNVQPSVKAKCEKEEPSFWSLDWKPPTQVEPYQDEERMGSPCKSMSYNRDSLREQDVIALPSINVKTKPKSVLSRTTVAERGGSKLTPNEINSNSNTCDDTTPNLQDDKSPTVFDSAKVKQVLQECADIIDVPKRQFLPELNTVPDSIELCYTPIVDKRYNRWKRRRRKRNIGDESGYKTVSPCESSSEENRDNKTNDPPLSNVKLRRRRRLPEEDDFGYHGSNSNLHDLHYDASCEFMSSDKDFTSYNTQTGVTTSGSNSNGTIEEHKERIRTALEQRAKDTLQQEVFHGGSYSGREEEHGLTPDLGNSPLQTTQITIARKSNTPPLPTAKTEEEENLTKSTPKLPLFKAKKTTYARKAMPFQEDPSRFVKPIDRSLVYHASSDSGAIVKLDNSNPSGDSHGQSPSGLFRVRMDKSSKERLLLSRMARHKVVAGNLIPRKRPVSEVKLPSSSATNRNISNLSLNHLLQTIPKQSTSKNKLVEGNNAAKKQDNSHKKEPGVLAPEVVGLQKRTEDSTVETAKKELKRSRKKKFTFPKKPLLDMMNKAYFREIERKLKNREINRLGNVSSLSFTPSFSYSLFELPEIYKKYNKEIESRVSMAWPVSEK